MVVFSKNKQGFINKVVSLGWTPDPLATIPGRWSDWPDEVSPYHFVREINGERYRVFLDHKIKGPSCDYHGPRLNYITLEHWALDPRGSGSNGELTYWRTVATLGRPTGYDNRYLQNLWNLTGLISEDPMKVRAERFLEFPLEYAWAAAKADWEDQEAAREQRRLDQIDREERRRPLAVNCDQDGYGSTWHRLSTELARAAVSVKDADGKSDLPTRVAEVQEALDAILAVLVIP